MTEAPILDVVVVGAGQAGLGIGYYLREASRDFVILERARIGETWRSQRWDSFALNTPNWMNGLPGAHYDGLAPDEFWRKDELVESFEQYVDRFSLPVRTGANVQSVRAGAEPGTFKVEYEGAGTARTIATRNVVVASGIMQSPRIPQIKDDFPEWITHLHTGDYRNPAQLPDGAVLVVGSGQSGCQIVEDLVAAGRTVFLCTSKVGRLPRRYRGRDILAWWNEMGFLDVRVTDLEDPAATRAAQPQISGLGRYGHTVSLQMMADQGVVLLGRATSVEGDTLLVDDSLAMHLRFGDERSAEFKRNIDEYIERSGVEAPAPEVDPADVPQPTLGLTEPIRRLDLHAEGIRTVIWSTGFTADFSWIDAPVQDPDGAPIHERGVSPTPGLYFLGFPWLSSRKSGIVLGIESDAEYIADCIAERL
jgi:putative flavoprotein involved in K+ transport